MADHFVPARADVTVFGGVDCHARVHQAVALDGRGRRLGAHAFAATQATQAGYAHLLGWLRRFGPVAAVGVESTGAYGAGLTRALTAAGVPVVEVTPSPGASTATPAAGPKSSPPTGTDSSPTDGAWWTSGASIRGGS